MSTLPPGSRPLDLLHGPLFEYTLLRLEARRHVLLLTLHHIVSDAWSIGVLLKELSASYGAFAGGQPSPLPASISIVRSSYSPQHHAKACGHWSNRCVCRIWGR